MPRFVVLRHEMPGPQRSGVHWDLMLEQGGVLRTWALQSEPAVGLEIAAEAIADHRLAYLDYEGPVSGDRGSVTRWDGGEYEFESDSADKIALQLRGTKLNGAVRLLRHGEQQWIFSYCV